MVLFGVLDVVEFRGGCIFGVIPFPPLFELVLLASGSKDIIFCFLLARALFAAEEAATTADAFVVVPAEF